MEDRFTWYYYTTCVAALWSQVHLKSVCSASNHLGNYDVLRSLLTWAQSVPSWSREWEMCWDTNHAILRGGTSSSSAVGKQDALMDRTRNSSIGFCEGLGTKTQPSPIIWDVWTSQWNVDGWGPLLPLFSNRTLEKTYLAISGRPTKRCFLLRVLSG